MKEQYIKIDEIGNKIYYSDKEMKIYHRENGPAIEWADGDKWWYLNGKRHREDGPAHEWYAGSKSWWLDGKLHREDGPAFEWTNGSKYWYLNGRRHHENGPAVEWADGSKLWYLNGVEYSETQFNEKMNLKPKININGREFTIEEPNPLIETEKKS